MRVPSIQEFQEVCKNKGYNFFDKGDYNVNIFGIRAKENVAGKWDDLFVILYKVNGSWNVKYYNGTVDPGQTELTNPSFTEAQKNGTAIMVEGQYSKLWTVGKHRGWDALVQIGNVKIYRDNNRDLILDKKVNSITRGIFGINFHPYWGQRKWYDFIYNWSAGCQVPYLHAESEEWKQLMTIFRLSEQKYGKGLTYTLFNESDFIK